MSGANPNKYQPKNYNDILNDSMTKLYSQDPGFNRYNKVKNGRTLSGIRKVGAKSTIGQKRKSMTQSK